VRSLKHFAKRRFYKVILDPRHIRNVLDVSEALPIFERVSVLKYIGSAFLSNKNIPHIIKEIPQELHVTSRHSRKHHPFIIYHRT
jgi:hypothetical protein